MENNKIICPKCGTTISIDEVLMNQIENQVKKKYEIKEKNLLDNLKDKQQELVKKEKNLNKIVEEKLFEEKLVLRNKIRIDVEKEKANELHLLENELEEKEKKIQKAREAELKIRLEKNKLEESKKEFEIKIQRQLDEERKKIIDKANREANEVQQFKIAELNKKLLDVSKVNDDLKRKLDQGSQQTQGEVLKLELEEILKKEFPVDEIKPINKGVHGADILQKIYDRNGRFCGQIIWESKRTKVWVEKWIQKLKDDQREARAEVAVLVTTTLPDDIKYFKQRNGVWVTNFNTIIGLALAIRFNLVQLNTLRLSFVGKNEKMEILFNYLSGTEFKHKIEGIVEAFVGMKEDLDKEKRAIQKAWSNREKQIQRVLDNTVGMYGDLSGIMGNSLQEVKMLELQENFDEDLKTSLQPIDMDNPEKINVSDLKSLSTRTLNVLKRSNIKNVGDIIAINEIELSELEGMGGKGMKEIRNVLDDLGLNLIKKSF